MFIIKKGNLIKILSFVFMFSIIVAGIFLNEKSQNRLKEQESDKQHFLLINNIYASLQSINSSFNKSLQLGTFENEKNEIYTQAYSIRNLIYFVAPNMPNTSKWFSDLCEYTETDMSDNEKNSYYKEKLAESTALLLNLCINSTKNESINKIENVFLTFKNKDYYRKQLEAIEENYPILNNQITADKTEITNLAKNILNFPISPKQFNGNYKIPKAISFSHISSYAEIFPSGKFINRMAVENTTNETSVNDLMIHDAAKHYLTIYAYYAENCKEIFSTTSNKLIYFVFCPETNSNNTITVNYNETIKLAINIADNSLKAFDASAYLKNHKNNTETKTLSALTYPPPQEIDNMEIISKKTAIYGQKQYEEYCFSPDGQCKYYMLHHIDNTKEIYTEEEYLRMLNIVKTTS